MYSKYNRIGMIILILFSLAACSTPATQQPTATASLQPTETMTPTATVEPTATVTPTETIEPTSTLIPTIIPTPVSGQDAAWNFVEKGGAYMETGQYEEAIFSYNQALVSFPWLIEAYYGLNEAQNLLELNQVISKLDEEIGQLDRAIGQDKNNAELYYQRGKAKYLKTLISGEPRVEESLVAQGWTIIGDPLVLINVKMDDVIADLNQAIQIDPSYAPAVHMRGLAYHLESLKYMGPTLVEVDETGLRKAIKDYEKAIQLDQELVSAYNDLGAAYTHQATQGEEISETVQYELMEKSINSYSKAIDLDTQITQTHLNRAYTIYHLYGLLNYSKGSVEEKETLLVMGIDDATQVIEVEPWNPWGYVLRGVLAGQMSQINNLPKWEKLTDEDFKKAEEVGYFLLLQNEVVDWLPRLTTLSTGPSIFPDLNAVLGYDYTNPDLGFRMKIPQLLSPNATIFIQMAESGDFLIRFYDDLARWYSLQVHPGVLGNQELEEWVIQNLTPNLVITEITLDDKEQEIFGFLYREENYQANCASAVQYNNQRFYTASYCLLDEKDPENSFRIFAWFQYEPVDEILKEFLNLIEIFTPTSVSTTAR